jgi:hypothetical protein
MDASGKANPRVRRYSRSGAFPAVTSGVLSPKTPGDTDETEYVTRCWRPDPGQ